MLHYDEEFNDECMKGYACQLPRVTREGYVGL